MKIPGVLIVGSTLAGLAGLAVILYLVAKPPERTNEYKPSLKERTFVSIEGVSRSTSTQKGRLNWTMASSAIDYVIDPKVVLVKDPSALIPVQDGGTVEVKGERGRYFNDAQDMEIEDRVDVTLTRMARLEWHLFGDTASYRKAPEAFFIGGLKGDITPADGDTMKVSGKLGRYDVRTRTMKITGDVVCSFVNGINLGADEIEYDLDTRLAVSKGPIRIFGQGWDLKGGSVLADLAARTVVVDGAVNVSIARKNVAFPSASGGEGEKEKGVAP